ncbi:MAG TPA: ABC transporter ATP-binding protein [Euryarchaeota archaeon]|nr:ABC transporter ATP-binding protein [Euryarchaeota archaeon]
MAHAIETTDLRKEFDGLVAVNDLSLTIGRGVLYGLIGPNGSGKTTVIRMLVGILNQTSGSATVLGERIPISENKPRIGYMPQEMGIYTDLTVHDNLELFSDLYSIGREKFRSRQQALLKMIDLEGRKDSLVSQLSGGMKHRVSLACALVHDPELIFLDEPTVGVDPELRTGFWEYFEELKRQGKTIVMTTHYMDEAQRCDIVGMMRNGRLIGEGSPSELMRRADADSLESAFLAYSREGGA